MPEDIQFDKQHLLKMLFVLRVLINHCISDETFFITVNDHFNVLLESGCKYFIEMFDLCLQGKFVYISLSLLSLHAIWLLG